jgi:hypothetical protein
MAKPLSYLKKTIDEYWVRCNREDYKNDVLLKISTRHEALRVKKQ